MDILLSVTNLLFLFRKKERKSTGKLDQKSPFRASIRASFRGEIRSNMLNRSSVRSTKSISAAEKQPC